MGKDPPLRVRKSINQSKLTDHSNHPTIVTVTVSFRHSKLSIDQFTYKWIYFTGSQTSSSNNICNSNVIISQSSVKPNYVQHTNDNFTTIIYQSSVNQITCSIRILTSRRAYTITCSIRIPMFIQVYLRYTAFCRLNVVQSGDGVTRWNRTHTSFTMIFIFLVVFIHSIYSYLFIYISTF